MFLPVNREWIGYDFIAGDWVGAHGKGEIADVYFRCDTEMTAPRDAKGTLGIKFPNEEEGFLLVQEGYLHKSEMKMPHVAPITGYTPTWSRSETSYQNEKEIHDAGYFFRTRVVKENDEIVSAHYGKFLQDIYFSPRHATLLMKNPKMPYSYATVSFKYYFNPTPNDRNVEFDPSKNLFKNLDSGQRVRDP